MRHVITIVFASYVSACFAGCCCPSGQVPSDSSESPDAADAIVAAGAQAMEFDGRTWTYVDEIVDSTGPFLVMKGFYYSTKEDDSLFLVDLHREEGDAHDWKRITKVVRQTEAKRRIRDGLMAEEFIDGIRRESRYKNEVEHGRSRSWHPNGNLRYDRRYIDGKLDGKNRAWYENGQLQYSGIYSLGEEISIEAWDEEGNPVPD